mgnify:CR=1 FL=1
MQGILKCFDLVVIFVIVITKINNHKKSVACFFFPIIIFCMWQKINTSSLNDINTISHLCSKSLQMFKNILN